MNSSEIPSNVVIIGIGNEWRGDDAIGLHIVRQLKNAVPDSIQLLEFHREMTTLIDSWGDNDVVILIDAVHSNKNPPGTLYRMEWGKNWDPTLSPSCSTHLFSVSQTIELAQSLGKLPRRLILIGIEGQAFTHQKGLSQDVRSSIEYTRAHVLKEIQTHI